MFIYFIYNHNWRNISTIFIYITRLASNEIFSPSNKIKGEVGRVKDLSSPRYMRLHVAPLFGVGAGVAKS